LGFEIERSDGEEGWSVKSGEGLCGKLWDFLE